MVMPKRPRQTNFTPFGQTNFAAFRRNEATVLGGELSAAAGAATMGDKGTLFSPASPLPSAARRKTARREWSEIPVAV